MVGNIRIGEKERDNRARRRKARAAQVGKDRQLRLLPIECGFGGWKSCGCRCTSARVFVWIRGCDEMRGLKNRKVADFQLLN